MTRYMVALDGSHSSENALKQTISLMDKQKDELILASITDRLNGGLITLNEAIVEGQRWMEKESERLLRKYGHFVMKHGIKNVTAVRGTSNHTGDMICQAAEKKKVDILVMGRRGLTGLKRLLIGSTSRYCLEHAPCNVLIVKEEAADKKMQEELNEVFQAKFNSDLDRNISRLAEEEERKRRVDEDKAAIEKEQENRVAAHIGAVVDEEEERKRRIREERVIEDRAFHVEDLTYEGNPAEYPAANN